MNLNSYPIHTITIAGVGLIGGSFARDCKAQNLCEQIIGYDQDESVLKKAVSLGVIDTYSTDLEKAVSPADLLFVSMPVPRIPSFVKSVLPFIKKGAIVTDAGSVKEEIVQEIDKAVAGSGIFFVGAHPIAGTEQSGVEASFTGLFNGTRTIITETDNTDPDARDLIVKLWKSVGSEVIIMDAVSHDRLFASISHLPHIIAYTLVSAVSTFKKDGRTFAAGGFKDITRIASSDPALWKGICLKNRKNIIVQINSFQETLAEIKECLEKNNEERLEDIFRNAKEIRDEI